MLLGLVDEGYANDVITYSLLTASLAPAYPLSIIPIAYVAYLSWIKRDYGLLAGAIAYVIIAWLRDAFIGSLIALIIALIYHIIYRVRPKGYLWLIWLFTLVTPAVTYFISGLWGLPQYINSFRAWWLNEAGGTSLIPIVFVAESSVLALTYSWINQYEGGEGSSKDSGQGDSSLSRLRNYFVSNPGASPVIAFMALLVAAAIELGLGFEGGANKLAELAYYYLVAGVLIELYDAVRSGD